jgi:hypothetical protein
MEVFKNNRTSPFNRTDKPVVAFRRFKFAERRPAKTYSPNAHSAHSE